ncbi:ATP-binding protein [Streptomyces zagrosensis]|uniref:Two-component sensor histidine kinase n=1 Tax=Streptomyces zagrosensis TaxID=1042984 RepID=A0A7W9QAP1_9ACTN|nr:ATP-binding protein [Streptomyces zagrosensis]MBB5936666.1 two-component sensor histidine kinase [Streptomyces zagrosensis]
MEILGSVPPGSGQAPPRRTIAYEGNWRFTAKAEEAAVPQARHAVRDLLKNQCVPVAGDMVHSLLLIVSELVTNAVKHAAVLSPEIAVEVSIAPEWVKVAVEDNHPYRPKALVADQGQTGGRGLLLVKAVADEVGGSYDVEHTASGGKVVWAALPLFPTSLPPGP